MTVPHAPHRAKKKTLVAEQDRLLIAEVVAAQLCGVSIKTFRNWKSAGVISPVALPGGEDGGRLRRNLYRLADLEALVDRSAAHS